ncbi:MAG: elongation factor Ts [Patescibacteria group bacterium]
MLSPFSFGRKRPAVTSVESPVTATKTAHSTPEVILKSPQSKNMITTEQIKALRDQTGVSVMQCKKALEEAGGDDAKALVILRKKSGELAAKKGDRTFGAGTIQSYIHSNGNVGSMVELNCETDFVANNDEFKALARDIAMHVAATNPKFLRREDITEADKKVAREVFEGEVKGKPEAVRNQILEGKLNAYFAEMVLVDQPFIRNPEVTIQGLIDAAVQKFGEKTAIARFVCFRVLQG